VAYEKSSFLLQIISPNLNLKKIAIKINLQTLLSIFYRRQLPIIEKCLPDFNGSPKRCSPNNFYIIKCLCIVHVRVVTMFYMTKLSLPGKLVLFIQNIKTLLIYIQTPKPTSIFLIHFVNMCEKYIFKKSFMLRLGCCMYIGWEGCDSALALLTMLLTLVV